ncbi:MAG: hypothetical protein A3D92_23545 [Bacteroidetes bacterium RIFCSPHIGHO2_02_FULL_44_7]|nr:MAG: hypothetical protein A3D92_23545 [Bacteroidetes bacterium RIFCSPHIGHO2_02_FULL_44_7]
MATSAKTSKILVVEDESMMREIVTHKLLLNGFDVKEAFNGKQAVEVWTREKPDLVLLDLILPEMDGFKILEIIRGSQDQDIAKTAVIVLSNLWTNEDILRAQNLKIEGYLVKAYFTTEDILNKVKQVLAQREKKT